MKAFTWIGVALVWAALVTGCTSTHMLAQESSTKFFDHINKAAKGRKGEIIFMRGEPVVGQHIHVTSDSTIWSDPTTGQKRSHVISEIEEIVIKDKTQGGLNGAIIGASLGALLGSNRNTRVWRGLAQGNPVTIVIPGVIGSGLIGWTIGVTIGHKERFVFIKRGDTVP